MSHEILDNNLVAICQNKITLTFNKPAYVGMCILNLSKVLMYESHYDYIKNKYSNNSSLLFTDTDGLMYKIKAQDVYADFSSDKEMYDFSNYLTMSKYYENSSKLVVRKMKDETGGAAIEEFVTLKPKVYSVLVDDNSEHEKENGVNINIVEKNCR